DIISNSLESKTEQIRSTAASLGCNMSLYIEHDGSDAEMQLLCSMVERIKEETNEQVILKELKCIYRMIKENDEFKQVANTLGMKSDFKTSNQEILEIISIIKNIST